MQQGEHDFVSHQQWKKEVWYRFYSNSPRHLVRAPFLDSLMVRVLRSSLWVILWLLSLSPWITLRLCMMHCWCFVCHSPMSFSRDVALLVQHQTLDQVMLPRKHVKDLPGHSAKSTGGMHPWPNEVSVGWLCCSAMVWYAIISWDCAWCTFNASR